jgi:hypothetical protein
MHRAGIPQDPRMILRVSKKKIARQQNRKKRNPRSPKKSPVRHAIPNQCRRRILRLFPLHLHAPLFKHLSIQAI